MRKRGRRQGLNPGTIAHVLRVIFAGESGKIAWPTVTALIGTLGGIGEIAKEVFRSEGTAGAQRNARSTPRVGGNDQS